MTARSPGPGWLATWTGRTMLGGGSFLGLGELAKVSPILAVTAAIVTGLVIITALMTQALPTIIAARAVARTARQACDHPQAERTLRVLTGTGYLDAQAPATRLLGHVVGAPPEAGPAAAAETAADSEPEQEQEVAPVRKLVALTRPHPQGQALVRRAAGEPVQFGGAGLKHPATSP